MEEQGTDAPSSVGSDSPSNSQDMGIDSSYSNQNSINMGPDQSYSNTNANIAASIAASIAQNPNYGRVTETIDRNQQIASMLGITPTNPFGYKSPFSGITDALGLSLDYSNIFGNQADMDAIAQKNVDVYSNPNNTPGMPGFDKDQPANQPRSGIQRGFGSLFNPVGQQTAYGKIAAQRPNDPMGSLAMGIFSNLAGLSLPSLMAQGIGRDTYAAKGTPGYDATIDPASPSYAGATSMGGIMDALSLGTTGMTSTTAQEAYGAVEDAMKEAYGYLSTAGKN